MYFVNCRFRRNEIDMASNFRRFCLSFIVDNLPLWIGTRFYVIITILLESENLNFYIRELYESLTYESTDPQDSRYLYC